MSLFLTSFESVDAEEQRVRCYNMKRFGNSNKNLSYSTYDEKQHKNSLFIDKNH